MKSSSHLSHFLFFFHLGEAFWVKFIESACIVLYDSRIYLRWFILMHQMTLRRFSICCSLHGYFMSEPLGVFLLDRHLVSWNIRLRLVSRHDFHLLGGLLCGGLSIIVFGSSVTIWIVCIRRRSLAWKVLPGLLRWNSRLLKSIASVITVVIYSLVWFIVFGSATRSLALTKFDHSICWHIRRITSTHYSFPVALSSIVCSRWLLTLSNFHSHL